MDVKAEMQVEARGVDRMLALLRERFWLVLAIAVLAAAALYGVTFVLTPIYRSQTILAPADLEKKGMSSNLSSALGSVSGFAALAGINFGGNDYATEEAIEVLKSEQFTQEFIDDHHLLPELFPSKWDQSAGRWKIGLSKVPTLGAGFRAFEKLRKVSRDTKSGLITLRIDWKDPIVAANWANEMVERLNDEMRGRALRQANASLGYLQHELAGTVEVSEREAISRLMEDAIKQQMLAHVTKEYALQVVDRALPSDRDAPARPIKLLYAAIGFVLGGIGGLWLADRLDRRRESSGR